MADLSIAYAGYQVFLQKKSGKRLRNRLWPIMPVLYLLTGLTGSKGAVTGLGAPNTSTNVLISGTKTAQSVKEAMFAETRFRPTVQYKKPNSADGKTIGQYSSMPVRSSGATKNPASYFIQPEFGFHERADPYEIPNDQIETIVGNSTGGWPAQATLAIGSIMDAEVKSVEAVHLKYFNDMLWGVTGDAYNGVGYPSDETAVKWDSLHSFLYAVGTTTNTYGGRDRSATNPVPTDWIPKTASTPKIVFRDFIRTLNYNASYRFADVGAGVDMIAVDGAGFQQALNECDGKTGVVLHNGLQDMAEVGFKRDIVCFDNTTYVIYDPTCPSGHIFAANSATWTVAIPGAKNFKVSTPKDQQDNKGGDDVTSGTIRTKMLMCCEEPAYNFYATGATY